MQLTNRYTKLDDLHSKTPLGEQACLVCDSIVTSLRETWKGWDKNGKHKSRKLLCRPDARINDSTRQVRKLRCQKKNLIITHVGTNNLQRMGSETLIEDMEQLCETANAKADSHIVIGLLPRYMDGRQLHDKILYINMRLKSMSHDKGFHFLDVYWAFNEKPHVFKDGLHLNDEGVGILDTSVSMARQVYFWTKRSQPSS